MLELDAVDLDGLCAALEDHSYEHSWWLDPRTGEIRFLGVDDDETPDDLDDGGLLNIAALDSGEGYRDMADFVSAVSNRKAHDLLSRAIEGRGAFRRFKDTLFEFPDLREKWFAFHDARMHRRGLEWLVDHDLISAQTAADAAIRYVDPPMADGAIEGDGLAAAVAHDLRGLYGARLVQVVMFGSRARGDDDDESDLDLLVVLADLESPWTELRRMDAVLWRHTARSGVTVSAFPVSRRDYEFADSPVLIRARRDAVAVG